jgi:hypothetical protein
VGRERGRAMHDRIARDPHPALCLEGRGEFGMRHRTYSAALN